MTTPPRLWVNFSGHQAVRPPRTVTIFCIPKPFQGHIGVIQRNAIASWTQLSPRPTVVLFGDEPGVAEAAAEWGLHHHASIQRNEAGTPLLRDVFAQVQRQTGDEVLVYANADIIFLDDLMPTVQTVAEQLDPFLIIGRRWDLEVTEPIHLQPDWQQAIYRQIQTTGRLGIPDAKDYFIFPRGLFASIPDFAVGRGYWDTWMIQAALSKGIPVVDGSLTVTAVHQEHDYAHIQGGQAEAYMGVEAQRNKALGGVEGEGAIAHATHQTRPISQQHAPTVSLIVITCNQAQALISTLESIAQQDGLAIEIIVVDDGSVDDTRGTLAHALSTSTTLSPHNAAIHYHHQPRQGIVAAQNRGLAAARGEFVTVVEAGVCLTPGALKRQVECFYQHASIVDILLSGIQICDGAEEIQLSPWTELPDLDQLHVWSLKTAWRPLVNSACMIRRDRLRLTGGWNPSLNTQAAHVDLILRLAFLRACQLKWLKAATQTVHRSLLKASTYSQKSQNARRQFELDEETRREFLDQFFEHSEVRPWMKALRYGKPLRSVR